MLDSLMRNLLLVSQLLSAKADNHVSKNKDGSFMYKDRKCYQDRYHGDMDQSASRNLCTWIPFLWSTYYPASRGDLCYDGYDIVFPGVGCDNGLFLQYVTPEKGGSFYCCEPIDCIEHKDKCLTENCCSPHPLPSDGPFVGCQDGYDLQWVTDQYVGPQSYCGPTYWNVPYKCCETKTTTTTNTIPRSVAFGYYDCSYVLPSLQNMDSCGLPVKMNDDVYAPCETLLEGGNQCRAYCLKEEGCEFYSVRRFGTKCNCTLKSWTGIKGAMDVIPATVEKHSEALKHCDLSVFVRPVEFIKNCKYETTCVYDTANGATWAISDWKKVDDHNPCWHTL